jgi:hypothetical protein
MNASLLRLASEESIPVRDLPQLSGISKEAMAMAQSRVKKFVLTVKGRVARKTYADLTRKIETGWKRRFGQDVGTLRETLESVVGSSSFENSPLVRRTAALSRGWRTSVAKPTQLPHFPMILHRGGFPDGS